MPGTWKELSTRLFNQRTAAVCLCITLGALCPPRDRARYLGVLHWSLRQLYAYSRYPEAAVKAEAAARAPQEGAVPPAAAAAYEVKQNGYHNRSDAEDPSGPFPAATAHHATDNLSNQKDNDLSGVMEENLAVVGRGIQATVQRPFLGA